MEQRGKNRIGRGESSEARGYFGLFALVLLVALLVFLGIRLHSWTSQRQASRAVTLVNAWNRMDDVDYRPKLVRLEGELQVDESCLEPLRRMLADCAAAGGRPRVAGAYRSREELQRRFDAELAALVAAGAERERARQELAGRLGLPGESEYELGLAVDIVDEAAGDRQEGSYTQQWLWENAWRYGFILRCPPDSAEHTGLDYDPCHYRYVGSAAGQIHGLGLTLEEYMGLFYSEEAEIVFDD